MKKERTITGGISNTLCRANSVKNITRKECRNNCKQWNKKEKKCRLNIK